MMIPSLLDLGPTQQEGNMPGAENLVEYLELVLSWVLGENLQPLLY